MKKGFWDITLRRPFRVMAAILGLFFVVWGMLGISSFERRPKFVISNIGMGGILLVLAARGNLGKLS